jgi:hypothetical protein
VTGFFSTGGRDILPSSVERTPVRVIPQSGQILATGRNAPANRLRFTGHSDLFNTYQELRRDIRRALKFRSVAVPEMVTRQAAIGRAFFEDLR